MTIPLIILLLAVTGLAVVATKVGGAGLALDGFRAGFDVLLSVIPLLMLAFALAGLVSVLVPTTLVQHWVGDESGLRGLLIATAAGIVTPGGPYLQFPLVVALANAGAGTGPIAAYLTAWSLLGASRMLMWELPLLGGRFAIARWGASLVLPVAIGLTVPVLISIR